MIAKTSPAAARAGALLTALPLIALATVAVALPEPLPRAFRIVVALGLLAPAVALLTGGRLRRLVEERRIDAVMHDPTTGLPGRALFHDRLAVALAAADRDSGTTALLLVDLDRFKEVNDTLGHSGGDLVLREVGRRLHETLRGVDTVARIGGDEFAIVLTGVGVHAARQCAVRLLQALRRPIVVDGVEFVVGGSVGIALYPKHADGAGALLRHADIAMYEAKRAGTGYLVHDADAASGVISRMRLGGELGHALARGEILLHYQPRLDLRSGELSGVEALARWRHPQLGLLPAERFIGLAEQRRAASRITRFALATALAQCAEWEAAGLAFPVAVNLDAHSIRDPRLPRRVARLLERHGVAPERLELEVSESAFFAAFDEAAEVLEEVAALGVGLVLDDFGRARGALAELPFSAVKLHRSLLLRAAASQRSMLVLRSTVELAHDLGLELVAEGVETPEELEFARAAGCDHAAGFVLAGAVDPVELVGALPAFGRAA